MNIKPPTKNKSSYFFETDHKQSDQQSIVVVKEDLCLVSSIVSYEDPYQSIYQYMTEESIYS